MNRDSKSTPKRRPTTVKAYIEGASPQARPHLHDIHRILNRVAPDGTEAIKWGVPVYWQGKVLFGFAAYQAHISFGPGEAAVKHFSEELDVCKTGKGTVQFPYGEALPKGLIEKIAMYCVANAREENENGNK